MAEDRNDLVSFDDDDALSDVDAQRWFYGGTPPETAVEMAYPFCDPSSANRAGGFQTTVVQSHQSHRPQPSQQIQQSQLATQIPLQAQCGPVEQGDLMG